MCFLHTQDRQEKIVVLGINILETSKNSDFKELFSNYGAHYFREWGDEAAWVLAEPSGLKRPLVACLGPATWDTCFSLNCRRCRAPKAWPDAIRGVPVRGSWEEHVSLQTEKKVALSHAGDATRPTGA